MRLDQIINGTGFEGLGENVQAAVAAHAEEQKAAFAKKIVDVLNRADEALTDGLVRLRTAQAAADKEQKRVDRIVAAIAHLKQSGNPMPFYRATGLRIAADKFCKSLGVPVPSKDDPIWTLPGETESTDESENAS